MKQIALIHRILLGLLMLIPGILKIFVVTPEGVTQMLAGFSIPAAGFFAWVLILSEILFGIAVLANWKIKYTAWPPIIILLVAAFTVWWANISQMIMHFIIALDFFWTSKMPSMKKMKK